MDSFYSYNNAVQQSLGNYNQLHELQQEKMKEEADKQSFLNTPLEVTGIELAQDAAIGLKKKAGGVLSKVGFKGAGDTLSKGGSLTDAVSAGTKDVVDKATSVVGNKIQGVVDKASSAVGDGIQSVKSKAASVANNVTESTSNMEVCNPICIELLGRELCVGDGVFDLFGTSESF